MEALPQLMADEQAYENSTSGKLGFNKGSAANKIATLGAHLVSGTRRTAAEFRNGFRSAENIALRTGFEQKNIEAYNRYIQGEATPEDMKQLTTPDIFGENFIHKVMVYDQERRTITENIKNISGDPVYDPSADAVGKQADRPVSNSEPPLPPDEEAIRYDKENPLKNKLTPNPFKPFVPQIDNFIANNKQILSDTEHANLQRAAVLNDPRIPDEAKVAIINQIPSMFNSSTQPVGRDAEHKEQQDRIRQIQVDEVKQKNMNTISKRLMGTVKENRDLNDTNLGSEMATIFTAMAVNGYANVKLDNGDIIKMPFNTDVAETLIRQYTEGMLDKDWFSEFWSGQEVITKKRFDSLINLIGKSQYINYMKAQKNAEYLSNVLKYNQSK